MWKDHKSQLDETIEAVAERMNAQLQVSQQDGHVAVSMPNLNFPTTETGTATIENTTGKLSFEFRFILDNLKTEHEHIEIKQFARSA